MIILGIIIFLFLNRIPKKILKERYVQLENNFNWKIPFMKLSGLVLCLFIAFLLVFGITISKKDTYFENKNAIYGLEFNDKLEEFGFIDSMKIKSINGQEIERVSDIYKKLIIKKSEIEVIVEVKGIEDKIVLNDYDIETIIQNYSYNAILPILFDSNGKNGIIQTEKKLEFSDVIKRFSILFKQACFFINPPSYESIGGFVYITNVTNISGYTVILSLNLIFIGIINFLPLPGFSFGNFLISSIETLRKKLFNEKSKRIISWILVFLVIGFLLLNLIQL